MSSKKVRKIQTRSQTPFLSQGRGGCELLPLEILEMILDNVKNRNELLSFRLVNSVWDNAVTLVLQRRCLNVAFQRDLPTDPEYGNSDMPFPTLTLVPSNHKHGGLSMAFYPRNSSPLPRGANPFVSKSLVLAAMGCCNSPSGTFQNIAESKRLSIYQLLQRHGSCLTSLQIYGAKTDPVELYNLLQQMPNLKSLTLVKIRLRDGFDEPITDPQVVVPASPVPQLTHAMLRVYSPTLSRWLVTLLAPQVVSLDFIYVDGSGIMPFDCTNYVDQTEKDLIPFRKLKHLKILGPSSEFISNTGVHSSIPLESLFIDQAWASDLTDDEMTKFIDRFAGTLVDLRLNIGANIVTKTNMPAAKNINRVKFPRLVKFAFYNVKSIGNFNWAKGQLLPRFKNLKTLRLDGFVHTLIQMRANGSKKALVGRAWKLFEDEGLWKLCRDLKSIEVPTYSYAAGQTVYTFTKRERDARLAKEAMYSLVKREVV